VHSGGSPADDDVLPALPSIFAAPSAVVGFG
jgi:hypothetical protein